MYVKHIKHISSHEKLKCNIMQKVHMEVYRINGYCTINVTTNVNAEGWDIFLKYFCIPLFKFKT